MTTFLLIRHASHDLLGKALAGRAKGVHLNERGRREAERLIERLEATAIAEIVVSPRERALETAAPLAARRRMTARVSGDFDEIDFGAWTGLTFDELSSDPRWRIWVEKRSVAQPPNGESFSAVHDRVLNGMERLRRTHTGQTIALVSHGDVIKAVLAHFLGMSLDHLERFHIAPASISVISIADRWAQVRLVNGVEGLPSG
jgi:probable phosphoglycerate mutase